MNGAKSIAGAALAASTGSVGGGGDGGARRESEDAFDAGSGAPSESGLGYKLNTVDGYGDEAPEELEEQGEIDSSVSFRYILAWLWFSFIRPIRMCERESCEERDLQMSKILKH